MESSNPTRVLFVCLHNAGRSQMSEAFFNRDARDLGYEGLSAGTAPASRLHPVVLEAMAERGFDLTDRKPTALTAELAAWADVVVTMGCGDKCPFVPGTRYIDWELEDPAGRGIAEVRTTRNEIEGRVATLISELRRGS